MFLIIWNNMLVHLTWFCEQFQMFQTFNFQWTCHLFKKISFPTFPFLSYINFKTVCSYLIVGLWEIGKNFYKIQGTDSFLKQLYKALACKYLAQILKKHLVI